MVDVSRWFLVDVRPSGVAVITRTAARYEQIEDIATAFNGVAQLLREHGCIGQVTDLRQAQGRNDEAFEAAMAVHRQKLFKVLPRNAVVVRTVIGKLQVERHMVQDGVDARVFVDLDEAIAALEASEPGPPASGGGAC